MTSARRRARRYRFRGVLQRRYRVERCEPPIRPGVPSRPSLRWLASRRQTSTSSSAGFCPVPIPARVDTFTELFPEFAFSFCGQRYDSVFVNSNGSLSFGTGGIDFSETIAEMLTGPPRIAALWDDLYVGAAPGSATFTETSPSLTVSFTNVPEFAERQEETPFRSRSSRVAVAGVTAMRVMMAEIRWRRGAGGRGRNRDGRFSIPDGTLSATDGLAGYSCGGRDLVGLRAGNRL